MGDIENISKKILRYLQRHPESADTIEGIATWWLNLEEIDLAVEEVATALELLLTKGKVRKIKSGKGTCLYKLAQHT